MIEFNQKLEDYFKGKKVEFIKFPEEKVGRYTSLNSFYKFIKNETDFWSKIKNHSETPSINQISSHFASMLNNLNTISSQRDNSSLENHNINLLDNVITSIQKNQFPCIFSETSIGQLLIIKYKEAPLKAEAYCNYLFRSLPQQFDFNSNYLSRKDYVDGLFESFLLENQHQVYNSEVSATTEAKSTMFSNFESHANELILAFTEEADKVKEKSNYESSRIEEITNEFKETSTNFLTDAKQQLEDLTMLYTQKLRLEGPATYWAETAQEYNTKGKIWTSVTVITAILFTTVLSLLLWNFPQIDSSLDFNSLKFAIVLTVIISTGMFIINYFIKISTSAFHLSRDANERYQLTHIYLSLLKEEGITDSERTIVMQSIFSRADTGLLKGDSTPSFPETSVIGQFMKQTK